MKPCTVTSAWLFLCNENGKTCNYYGKVINNCGNYLHNVVNVGMLYSETTTTTKQHNFTTMFNFNFPSQIKSAAKNLQAVKEYDDCTQYECSFTINESKSYRASENPVWENVKEGQDGTVTCYVMLEKLGVNFRFRKNKATIVVFVAK